MNYMIIASLLALTLVNDGALTMGGSPELLTGHPTVRMESELIKIWTDGQTVKADCQFVFKNSGPACEVKMGFPDAGLGADDPYEGMGPEETKPVSALDNFLSWVDGKAIKTKLEVNKERHTWHTKMVHFPAHSTVRVRDTYRSRCGGGIFLHTKGEGSLKEVGYIVHTGASWKGTIGRTEVRFTFAQPQFKHTKWVPFASVTKLKENAPVFQRTIAPNEVVWETTGTPTVAGNTVTWVRTNWKPTEKDDPSIAFDFQGFKR